MSLQFLKADSTDAVALAGLIRQSGTFGQTPFIKSLDIEKSGGMKILCIMKKAFDPGGLYDKNKICATCILSECHSI